MGARVTRAGFGRDSLENGQIRRRRSPFYGDFENVLLVARLGCRDVHGEATLDRLVQIAHEFVHGVALCGATRNRRDFGPEAAFLRFVHHHFDLHAGRLRSGTTAKIRRGRDDSSRDATRFLGIMIE